MHSMPIQRVQTLQGVLDANTTNTATCSQAASFFFILSQQPIPPVFWSSCLVTFWGQRITVQTEVIADVSSLRYSGKLDSSSLIHSFSDSTWDSLRILFGVLAFELHLCLLVSVSLHNRPLKGILRSSCSILNYKCRRG